MTNYIDELDRKQQPKGKKPRKQASAGSPEANTQRGKDPLDTRVPARKLFGDQGDFEDGTIKD